MVNGPKNIVEAFVESEDKESKDKIFAEFNTLTVVYGIPAEKFLAQAKAKEDEEEDMKASAAARAKQLQSSASASASTATAAAGSATDKKTAPAALPAKPPTTQVASILPFEAPSAAAAPAATAKPQNILVC